MSQKENEVSFISGYCFPCLNTSLLGAMEYLEMAEKAYMVAGDDIEFRMKMVECLKKLVVATDQVLKLDSSLRDKGKMMQYLSMTIQMMHSYGFCLLNAGVKLEANRPIKVMGEMRVLISDVVKMLYAGVEVKEVEP